MGVLSVELSSASAREKRLVREKERLQGSVKRKELALAEAEAKRAMEAERARVAEIRLARAKAGKDGFGMGNHGTGSSSSSSSSSGDAAGLRHVVDALRSDLIIRDRIHHSLERMGAVAETRAVEAEKRALGLERTEVPQLKARIEQVRCG